MNPARQMMMVPVRQLVVNTRGEDAALRAEELLEKHASLDFSALMTAVIRHGTWAFYMVNKYGPEIINDINDHFGK